MKKLLVIALAIVLTLAIAAVASAETRTYLMMGVADTEGNVYASVTDDGSAVVDAEGNDVTEDFPIIGFVVDDDAMTGVITFDDEGEAVTLTMKETAETAAIITATFDDGSALDFMYDGENDAFALVDENGLVYTLLRVA